MCGHGIIAVTTIALERGLLVPGGDGATVVYDAPAGTIRARGDAALSVAARGARTGSAGLRLRRASRVESVAFVNVPSFVLHGGLTVKLGVAAAARRRRVRRRLLRHRRQRSGGPADRRGALAGTAPRRHGDQARDRGGADDRASARARAARHLRHDLHRPAERRARRSAQRDDLRRRRGRSIAVRHRNRGGDGGHRRDGTARRRTGRSCTRA